ncbi:MAG: protein kinase [Deltaproteobacteria bacterium]|nr:protein kinase [Deltaproteobacteria bacterium]
MAQRFGRYWLQEKIGHGGMAEVFRATIGPDAQTYAFDLALKRLHPELIQERAMVDMFLTEADIAKFLRHPNVVQVFEAGLIDNQPYIAMEFVRGTDLASLVDTLRKRRLRCPADLALYVALQVLRALDYVHRAVTPTGELMELVHRDVTPSNIYITFDGKVKLGDFGIARVRFLEERDDLTLKGKVAYMPPEVLVGAPINANVDLWGLAVTLWELLATRRLYEGLSDEEIRRGVAPKQIMPVHEINPEVPLELSHILHRALSARPRRRPQDAVAFYRELKLHLRATGLQVDSERLGRFLVGLIGYSGDIEQEYRGPQTGVFERPAYAIPMGMSPTQRFEIVMRRKRIIWPAVTIGAALLVGSGIWAWQTMHAHNTNQTAIDLRPVIINDLSKQSISSNPQVPHKSLDNEKNTAPEDYLKKPNDADERVRPIALDVSNWNRPKATHKPRRFNALIQRASQQARQKKYIMAERYFQQALTLRPNNVDAILARADTLIELRHYNDAEKAVRKALTIDPRNARAYLLLGDVLWMQGRDQSAREAYRHCIDVEPNGKSAKVARKVLDKIKG